MGSVRARAQRSYSRLRPIPVVSIGMELPAQGDPLGMLS